MTDEEILKKLQIARDAWGQGYASKGYSPHISPSAGQEGYEDILRLKLNSLNKGYGKDAKYGYGDPMKHFTNADEIETLLGYEIVDKPLPSLVGGPSHFDMMSKVGIPRTTEGYSLGTSSYDIDDPMIAGTSLGASSVDLMGPAGLLEGPETANMQLSPYELTLLAENQQRHPSAPPLVNPPRFPAANQMGVAEGYDHQRINPPRSLAGGSGPMRGLLDSEPSDDNQAAYQALLNEVPSSKPVKTTGRTGKGWESQREFDPNNRRRYNPAWAAMITGGLDLAFD